MKKNPKYCNAFTLMVHATIWLGSSILLLTPSQKAHHRPGKGAEKGNQNNQEIKASFPLA